MPRITVAAASPWMAQGLRAAIEHQPGWRVMDAADTAPADAGVLHAQTAAETQALLAMLPPQAGAVLLGEALHEAVERQPPDTRALALLAESATPGQLRAALAAVLEGLAVRDLSSPFRRPLHDSTAEHEPLTPREHEVFELLGKGLSNRDIAGVLGISAHTAKFHVGQILAKVGAATRAEAVSAGLRLGLIGL